MNKNIVNEMKKCMKCGEEKPVEDFYKKMNYNRTETAYKESICKDCEKLRVRKWAIENRERWNRYLVEYRKRKKLLKLT